MRPLLMLTMALAATGMVPCPYPARKPSQASPEAQALAIERARAKRARKNKAREPARPSAVFARQMREGARVRESIRAINPPPLR